MQSQKPDRYVYIAQLKCPGNHCVLALAGTYDSAADAAILGYELGTRMAELVESKTLNYECGICKATNFHVEIDRTRFRTMADAAPVLMLCEADQRSSAEWLKRSRQ